MSQDKQQFTVVAIYASDWGVFSCQMERDDDFTIVTGWVIGELVKEDEQRLVIAHHAFADGNLRHVTTVPKVNVIERKEWTVEGSDHHAPEAHI